MQETYADVEIRVMKYEEQGYPVEITYNSYQAFPRGLLKREDMPSVTTAPLYPREYGEELFEWLFADRSLADAWATIRGRGSKFRIRLRIDDSASELYSHFWELLCDRRTGECPRVLAASVDTPFSHFLASHSPLGIPVLSRPIKVLMAIANAENLDDYYLDRLDVMREQQIIQDAVTKLGYGQADLHVLDSPVTLANLQTELRKGYHVLHVVAHGARKGGEAQTVLLLEDNERRVARVSAAELAEMLDRQGTLLRLVFLASCETAVQGGGELFPSFAHQLVAAGVPAVLAMRGRVSDETAREFAKVFYEQLLEDGRVDVACNCARSAVLAAKLPDAASPVLFMRLRDGRLFDQRGQILGRNSEVFWRTLLKNIADGSCLPFLGPGVTEELLPAPRDIARALADEYAYPFENCDNFPNVAQFVSTEDSYRLRSDFIRSLITGLGRRMEILPDRKSREQTLSQVIEDMNWSDRVRTLIGNEIHHQLADLNLPLYLTTNFDSFMTTALRARGKDARRRAVDWRRQLKTDAERPLLDFRSRATPNSPVVLHLFGTDDELDSMVLTEDDHLDYLVRISRDKEYIVPASVPAAIRTKTLLFLGYRLEDLDFRVIMRGLLSDLNLSNRNRLHVTVQLEDGKIARNGDYESVREFFRKYFQIYNIELYWGTTRQFVSDLHAHWEGYLHG